jgi:SAM-dependent methyltransferase
MRRNEARYVGSLLSSLSDDQLSPVVNLGSSTLHFRRVAQPHIEEEIFHPLQQRGIAVVHADLKAAPGVDVVGNIYDPLVAQKIKQVGAKLILCCNIIEHVTDPQHFMRICASLLAPGGKLLVTVPYSYPYHPDPIDTYLRLSPREVAELVDGFEVSDSRILDDTTYLEDLNQEGSGYWLSRHFALHIAKFFWPFSKFDAWKARYHRYFWLFRRYRTTCVLLTKSAAIDRMDGPALTTAVNMRV